jgi:hypothetical protein
LLVVCYVGIGLGLPMAISLIEPVYLAHRYSIAAWPGGALLVGRGLSLLPARWMRSAVAASIGCVSAVGIYWHFAIQEKAPDRIVAQYLDARLGSDGLVVFTPHWLEVSVGYYLTREPAQIGYPFRTLPERALRSETAECDRRPLDDVLRTLREWVDGGRGPVLLVRGRFALNPEGQELKAACDRALSVREARTWGYIDVTEYAAVSSGTGHEARGGTRAKEPTGGEP